MLGVTGVVSILELFATMWASGYVSHCSSTPVRGTIGGPTLPAFVWKPSTPTFALNQSIRPRLSWELRMDTPLTV